MDLATFRNRLRVLLNDHAKSNQSIEPLTLHLDNIVDGTNTLFYLMNRRVISTSIRVFSGNVEVVGPFTYHEDMNSIVITPPPLPSENNRVAYYWQRLTDAEFDEVINTSIHESNLSDVSVIDNRNERVVMGFCRANFALFIAHHAAEYYSVSAGGKSVSKESIFQHYFQMYETERNRAMQIRDDYYQGQGEQHKPAAGPAPSNQIDEDYL